MGKILREWGVRGQVRFISYNPESDLISKLANVYLELEGEFRPLAVESAKAHGRFWLLKLAGYGTPETAQALRQIQIAVPRSLMPQPVAGEIYLCDLEGAVVQNHQGEVLGKISRFIRVGDSEVMVISREGGSEAMVPYRSEFVQLTRVAEGLVVLKDTAQELL